MTNTHASLAITVWVEYLLPVLLVPINQYTTLMQVAIVFQSRPVSILQLLDNLTLSTICVPRVTTALLERAISTQMFA